MTEKYKHRISRIIGLGLFLLTLSFASVGYSQDPGNYSDLLERAERAGIPSENMVRVIERAEGRNYGTDRIRQFLEPAVNLAEQDLPYDFIFQKSMEGMAKNVSPGNIGNVLQNFENGITRSAEIIDPWLESDEIRASIANEMRGMESDEAVAHTRKNLIQSSAQAMNQNVDEQTINEFLNEVTRISGQRNISVSSVASGIRIMSEMPTTPENPQLSREILVNAVASGFNANQMQQLPAAMNSAQFFTDLPAEAVGRGVSEQMGRDVPGNRVLENLFRGDVRGGPPGVIPPGQNRIPGRNGDRPGDRPGGPPDDPPGGPPDDPPGGPPGNE